MRGCSFGCQDGVKSDVVYSRLHNLLQRLNIHIKRDDFPGWLSFLQSGQKHYYKADCPLNFRSHEDNGAGERIYPQRHPGKRRRAKDPDPCASTNTTNGPPHYHMAACAACGTNVEHCRLRPGVHPLSELVTVL